MVIDRTLQKIGRYIFNRRYLVRIGILLASMYVSFALFLFDQIRFVMWSFGGVGVLGFYNVKGIDNGIMFQSNKRSSSLLKPAAVWVGLNAAFLTNLYVMVSSSRLPEPQLSWDFSSKEVVLWSQIVRKMDFLFGRNPIMVFEHHDPLVRGFGNPNISILSVQP